MLLVITYENYQLRKRPLSLSLRPPSSTSALRLTTTELNFSSRAEVVTHEPSAVSQYLSRVTPVTTSLVKPGYNAPWWRTLMRERERETYGLWGL